MGDNFDCIPTVNKGSNQNDSTFYMELTILTFDEIQMDIGQELDKLETFETMHGI